ncbi:unnamed protein product [Ceutorhynchus assimilis]|uniref:Mab-21-like nucleotidyltransferase domain-containing protein n=1 Tax=Ceutorhynchus assimilis TaxID=467358 RepID=A0A9N9MVZ3_9CUCU|nr:unnamed protein product [Ceutorhynchus assimilis]
MTSYKNMEQILQNINRNYIQLKTEEVKHNNEILKSTLERMIEIMKALDPLFEIIYQKPFFGGSFYDDLKVGKPDEFKIDLVMVFSKIVCQKHKTKKCGCVVAKPSNKPGFFWFKVNENFYQPLNKFIVDEYMRTDLILFWMQSLVTRALNLIRSECSSLYKADVEYKPPGHFSQSVSAIKLRLYGKFGHMNVDLVPAFKFGPDSWPEQGFRPNPSDKEHDFFIVPEKTSSERYWRASFPCQERELLNNKQRLKPALRLLKKMRNNLDHQISSYALKTIVLLELDSGWFNWEDTLADTFMKLLKKYRDCLNEKKIPYYWNKRNNMLDCTNDETLTNHYNEIAKKIRKIDREYMDDPFVIAKVILREGSEEYKEFRRKYGNDVMEDESTTDSEGDDLPSYDRDRFSFSDSSSSDDLNMRSSYSGSNGRSGMNQATSSSDGGLTTGLALLGVGAAAVVALGVFGALRNNNRRND